MRTLNSHIGIIVAMTFSIVGFQNCGQFKITDPQRTATLERSVLGTDNLYNRNGRLSLNSFMIDEEGYPVFTPTPTPVREFSSPTPSPTPTSTPGTTPTPTPGSTPTPTPTPGATPTPTSTPSAELLELPIKRLCDGDKSYWWNYNGVGVLQGNNGIFLRITNSAGSVLCELRDVRDQLVSGKIRLPQQCLGNMSRADFLDKLAYSDRTKPIKFQIFVLKGSTEWQINDPKKRKDNGVVMQQLDPSWIYMGNNVSGENCDQTLSPLFVDFRSQSEYDGKSPLSNPDSGVLFNLLGDFPLSPFASNQKVKVSWFKNPKLMYLALPNSMGRVDGINELFGDHTKGPDEKGADHGFAALAKYDGFIPVNELNPSFDRKANGVIDSKDWIFSKLRFWSDRNFNGISESDELIPIFALGIQSIDLNFDEKYREMDQHKNEVRYKSVVVNRYGKMHLIFDVWLILPKN